MSGKKYILNKEEAAQKLQRLALQVAEELSGDTAPLIIIGIQKSGMTIAEKIGALLSAYFPTKIIAASMNKSKPDAITLSETVDFNDTNILICDDVANSGKTLLYVLKPLLQSHPKRIQTLVMVERMHKLFPIKPDYVGLSLATTLQEHIYVEVTDGEVVGAYIE